MKFNIDNKVASSYWGCFLGVFFLILCSSAFGQMTDKVDSARIDDWAFITSPADSSVIGANSIGESELDLGTGAQQISLVDMLAGNWKMFFSNGSGIVTEVALGPSGQVWKSTGTTSAPSWQSGGTGDLLADGSVPMTADWPFGDFDLTGAEKIEADSIETTHLSITGADNGIITLIVSAGTDSISITISDNGDTLLFIDSDDDTLAIMYDDDAGNTYWKAPGQNLVMLPDSIGMTDYTDNSIGYGDIDWGSGADQVDTSGWTDAVADQSIKGDHVDSTAEDFVFDNAYEGTSAEPDSQYSTHNWAREEIGDSLSDLVDANMADNALDPDKLVGDVVDDDKIDSNLVPTITNAVSASHADSANLIHLEIRNNSGTTIVKGTPIFDNGWNVGTGEMLVGVASASNVDSMPAVGLLDFDVANNTSGSAIMVGILRGVAGSFFKTDSSGWTQGDAIYVGPGAVGLTNIKPTNGNLIQKVGDIVSIHTTLGVITVSGAGRTNDVPNADGEGEILIGGADSAMVSQPISGDGTLAADGTLDITFSDSASVVSKDVVMNIWRDTVATTQETIKKMVSDSIGTDTIVVNSILEIPNGTAPDPTLEGQIFQDTDDDMIEGTDGTNDFIFAERYKTFKLSIDSPENLTQDTIFIPIRGFAPGGIIIDSIGLGVHDSVGTYAVDFEEWTSRNVTAGTETAISTVTVPGNAFDVAVGSIAHTIEYGNLIMIEIPATAQDRLDIWIRYEVLGND